MTKDISRLIIMSRGNSHWNALDILNVYTLKKSRNRSEYRIFIIETELWIEIHEKYRQTHVDWLRSIIQGCKKSPEMLPFAIRGSQNTVTGTLRNLESMIRECNGSRMMRERFEKSCRECSDSGSQKFQVVQITVCLAMI